MVTFFEPQVILFVEDCERASAFYARFGFVETFRTEQHAPAKIEVRLGGFTLGLALPGPAAESHGLEPVTTGHRAAVTLWTDDVDRAFDLAVMAGGTTIRGPHAFRERLRIALIEDLDGHPVQLVQAMAAPN